MVESKSSLCKSKSEFFQRVIIFVYNQKWNNRNGPKLILFTAMIANDFVVSLRNLDPSTYKIVAVAASNLEAAQKFAKKFGIEKAYGSYLELCQDEEVQLVYVCNINTYHYSSTRMALEHGKVRAPI